MLNLNYRLLLCYLLLLYTCTGYAQMNTNDMAANTNPSANKKYEPTWASLDQRKTPNWFKDAKFGIFIHWGVYSVPAWAPTGDMNVYAKYAEWYWRSLLDEDRTGHEQFVRFHENTYGKDFKYQDFAPMFKAAMFEPEDWAALFKQAGAQYVVLTSKHHEGFCLWPSQQSWNWNSVDIGPHRDLAGELSEAVKDAGLKMGFYYSLYEWYNPLYHENFTAYVDNHMIPQMKDLVTRYEPEIFWADGEWDHSSDAWKSQEFLAWLYNESPVGETVAVNDRWGKETRSKHGGFYTTEYGLVHDGEGMGDASHAWEECRGIGGSFGYNRQEDLSDYQSSEALIHLLIDLVSNGGNLLLNVGPTADGIIPVIMQERLLDIGQWLQVNGEAIYGTKPWKASEKETALQYTQKGKNVYAIHKGNPGKTLLLKGLKLPAGTQVRLLGSDKLLTTANKAEGISIDLSNVDFSKLPTQHAYAFVLENYQ